MKRNTKYILLVLILLFILIVCLFYNKTKEGFLETKYDKTIYLVWQNKIKNNITNHGFGDKLRGALLLYQYCNENHINFKLDATDDVCSDFLKNVISSDYDKIKNQKIINLGIENVEKKLMNSGDQPLEKIIETIQTELSYNNSIFIYTNMYPMHLTANDKLFAKYICEPKNDIVIEINDKIKNFPKDFGIQHFRFNDSVFKNDVDLTDPFFKKYFDLLKMNYKKTDILFTNSNNFKKYAKEKLKIKTVDCNDGLCKIQHIGASTDNESVRNSFIEFFILSKAKYITSYTCYTWPSNFVNWTVQIYDIPFTNVYINEKDFV